VAQKAVLIATQRVKQRKKVAAVAAADKEKSRPEDWAIVYPCFVVTYA